MGINEYKSYPRPEEFLSCSKDGKGSSWENVNTIKNTMGVEAIVDSKGNRCIKKKSCELIKKGICNVPDIYKGAEPLTPSVKSISKLYLIVFQDNCGNAKCKKEGRYRLGCLEISPKTVVKKGTTWDITATVSFLVTVSMKLEVTASGVKVVKDGSGRLKLGATYPAKAVFVKQNEASGGAMQKLKKYYLTKKCARGKTVKAYLYDLGLRYEKTGFHEALDDYNAWLLDNEKKKKPKNEKSNPYRAKYLSLLTKAMPLFNEYFKLMKCLKQPVSKDDWGAADQSLLHFAREAKKTLPTRIDRSSSRLKF